MFQFQMQQIYVCMYVCIQVSEAMGGGGMAGMMGRGKRHGINSFKGKGGA